MVEHLKPMIFSKPRASPLWQIVHHGWDAFLAHYEKFSRTGKIPLWELSRCGNFLKISRPTGIKPGC